MPNKLELIQQLQEAVSMLNEVVNEPGQEKEVNKIKREEKDKKGNTVEVVSVEDELFPKEGNAKEQYNQKVIDIINQMIEGKATLEDLLQFVRGQKAASKKKAAANESLERVEEAISNAIQVICELNASTYGSATGKREELARQDVVKEREAEEKYKKHKAEHPEDKEGLQKLAQEWDEAGTHNKLDRNSNVNKWSRDLARSNMKANSLKKSWNAEQRADWEKARKKEVKTDIGNTPYKHMPRW